MRSCLGWRGKTSRSSSLSWSSGSKIDQLVAVGVAREVAEPRARVQVVLLAPHALEPRREALLAVVALDDLAPLLALLAAPAPVELEQHVAVEVGVDVVEVDVDLAHAPERRLGDRRRRCAPASARESSVDRRRVVDHDRLLAQLAAPRRGSSSTSAVARLVVDQLVHRVEALEGVLAVEDAGLVDLVGLLALRVEDAAAEVAVDRRAADQHRELEPALVQLLRRRSASASRSRRAAPRARSRRPRAPPRRR